MIFKRVPVGVNYTNSYIIGQEDGNGIIVDPGDEARKLLSSVEDLKINLTKIIITHAHFDHIGAVEYLREETGAEVLIHEKENEFLKDPDKNLSFLIGKEIVCQGADTLLGDGDVIGVSNGLSFEVIFTPGHSPGGICLYNKEDNYLLSGDTIFFRGVGRTDFQFGNEKKLIQSIENKILILPEDTVVYPGHGASTTIGDFKNNYWETARG
ncbi:MBL fold metallo-hydrolase [Halothermothrix orenii]|uniref:Beta-lactamase domain protein n=1 Tax=Halothermothrix orenii (strain H 168 / OCM 544 / DSM 9562) TaxID=373903 RepID=B8CXE8_HALOH|nr:MBL fold metallo-hydrolase [Halothermothrix orenii]ACL69967.1 beta-lactamase domain protein [Halothermothrix orenii H 168]